MADKLMPLGQQILAGLLQAGVGALFLLYANSAIVGVEIDNLKEAVGAHIIADGDAYQRIAETQRRLEITQTRHETIIETVTRMSQRHEAEHDGQK